MTSKSPLLLRVFLSLVAFSLAGSLLSKVTKLDPGPIAPLASVLTIAVGVAATFARYPGGIARIASILALGTAAELVGLATGYPFGRYAYTTTWWPSLNLGSLGPFPLLLPFAWLMMAGAANQAIPPVRFRPLLAGGLAALIDLLMEPVMAGPLHYWKWLEQGPLPGGAPLANFFGWWGVSTMAAIILGVGGDAKTARWTLAGFTILVIGLGLIRA